MALQFLDATTISMGEIFLTVLSERLADTGDIWGEKPRLHINGITFRRRETDKMVIPIVETYVILGGLYKNGNYYKVSPFGEMPGKYDYQHKLCFYSLNPTTYRKICEQRIRDALSEIILHQRDYLPERMCGVTVQQTSVAHEVSLQTTGHNARSMLVIITPAIEGAGIPEGVREPVVRHFENQRIHPMWLLVPCSRRPNELQSWNITFRPLEAALLQRSAMLQQTVLFLTWFSEKHGWGERGLPTSYIFSSIAFIQLHLSNGSFAAERFTVQVKVLLTQLRSYLQAKRLEDFFVLKKNILEQLPTENLESIQLEVDEVLQNMMQTSTSVDDYIRSNYPYYITRGDDEDLSSSNENLVVQEILEKNVSLPLPEAIDEDDLPTRQAEEEYAANDHRVIVEEPVDDSIPISSSVTNEAVSVSSSNSSASVRNSTNNLENECEEFSVETTEDGNVINVTAKISNVTVTVEQVYKEEEIQEDKPILSNQFESTAEINANEQVEQNVVVAVTNYNDNNVNNNINKDIADLNENDVLINPPVISVKTNPSKSTQYTNNSEKDHRFVANGSAALLNGAVNNSNGVMIASISPVATTPLAVTSVGDTSSPSTTVMNFMGNFQHAFVYSILAFVVVSIGIAWMMSTDIESILNTQLYQEETNTNSSEKEL